MGIIYEILANLIAVILILLFHEYSNLSLFENIFILLTGVTVYRIFDYLLSRKVYRK